MASIALISVVMHPTYPGAGGPSGGKAPARL
jgi:hypothetical protein